MRLILWKQRTSVARIKYIWTCMWLGSIELMYLLGAGEVWAVYHMPWHIFMLRSTSGEQTGCTWRLRVLSIPVFWDVMLCHWVRGFQCFEGTCCLQEPLTQWWSITSQKTRIWNGATIKPQSSQIMDLVWCDTILWQMDGTILVLPVPSYMGSHLDICCCENLRYH
jgi:hypothetical protein